MIYSPFSLLAPLHRQRRRSGFEFARGKCDSVVSTSVVICHSGEIFSMAMSGVAFTPEGARKGPLQAACCGYAVESCPSALNLTRACLSCTLVNRVCKDFSFPGQQHQLPRFLVGQ